MTQKETIVRTQRYLKQKFSAESSGHDYWHLERVHRLAKHIAGSEEGADIFTVELAALLHDIADWKFYDGDDEAGPKAAREWLAGLAVNEKTSKHVEDIIRSISFKGAGTKVNLTTIEGRVVHDADKLDAMGAIGVARNFAYGGHHGWLIHDPDLKPTEHRAAASWKIRDGSAINMFYEKFFLLKDRMCTETARAMAQHRHEYMEQYLQEFLAEWDGRQ